jgi:hypothetical protein
MPVKSGFGKFTRPEGSGQASFRKPVLQALRHAGQAFHRLDYFLFADDPPGNYFQEARV